MAADLPPRLPPPTSAIGRAGVVPAPAAPALGPLFAAPPCFRARTGPPISPSFPRELPARPEHPFAHPVRAIFGPSLGALGAPKAAAHP